jgi:imidazole glycerol-phosphate synthase subunit HisH
MKIVIADYGMGNIRSLVNAFNYLGEQDVAVSDSKAEIDRADRLILPGVGNFATAMARIKDARLDEHLAEAVLGKGKPILGICLGMQLMAKSGTEGGFNPGLAFVQAMVDGFDRARIKVPHIGFNQVVPAEGSRLYRGIGAAPDFYFIHSFRMAPFAGIGQSMCQYSEAFAASFETGNIAGVQFHPELSQTNGLKLLKNFITEF